MAYLSATTQRVCRTLILSLTAVFLLTPEARSEPYRSSSYSLEAMGYGRQSSATAEYNLAAQASVAVTGTFMRKGEDLAEREIEDTHGESLTSMGREFAVLFSRYSHPESMSGLYWTLGPGYRTMSVTWDRHPKDYENKTYLSLNSEGKAQQEFTLQGPTLHGGIGYRFLSESFPVTLGIYLGIRHYQATVRDSYENSGEGDESHTHEDVRTALQHRYMTSPEPSITFGLVL